ncbi:MAG: hypothetical protein R3A10_11160 [Caldilineaceae bacterium]
MRLYGLSYRFHEHISDTPVTLHDAEFYLEPYQVMWLEPCVDAAGFTDG